MGEKLKNRSQQIDERRAINMFVGVTLRRSLQWSLQVKQQTKDSVKDCNFHSRFKTSLISADFLVILNLIQ